MRKHRGTILFWFLAYGAVLFLALNRHSRTEPFTYHSQIWADKAGYYIYLPGTFLHGMRSEALPDSLPELTGKGFSYTEEGYLFTKYTSGVAWLQLPFFAVAQAYDGLTGQEVTGFSPASHTAIDLAAVTYALLALFLLARVLRTWAPQPFRFLVLFFLFFGTNLYYYTVGETGMSHVYSFFVFAALAYLLAAVDWSQHRLRSFALLGFLTGLALLIRPTHALALIALVPVFTSLNPKRALHWRDLKRPANSLALLAAAAIVWIPQVLYWYAVSGQGLLYSYGEEAFHWLNPQLLSFAFAPLNGLLLYTPLLFLVIVGLLVMLRDKEPQAAWIGTVSLLSVYVFSCWWDWSFGCGLGSRNYVEYSVLFALPMTRGLQAGFHTRLGRISLLFFLLLCMVYTLKLVYSFDGCFPGAYPWDWEGYQQWLFGPTK